MLFLNLVFGLLKAVCTGVEETLVRNLGRRPGLKLFEFQTAGSLIRHFILDSFIIATIILCLSIVQCCSEPENISGKIEIVSEDFYHELFH